MVYSHEVCLAPVCLSDDGIALNGIQLCSILIRFQFLHLLTPPSVSFILVSVVVL